MGNKVPKTEASTDDTQIKQTLYQDKGFIPHPGITKEMIENNGLLQISHWNPWRCQRLGVSGEQAETT